MVLDKIKERVIKENLNKKQIDEILNNLTPDEIAEITEFIDRLHKIHYVFKDDDFSDYTEDENEINERANDIYNAINGYKQEDLDYTKESILNPYLLKILATCIKDTSRDLGEDRLNELIRNYNKINDFINTDEKHDDVLAIYGDIVTKDYNGFYNINDAIINNVIRYNEFNIKENDKEPIKDAINTTWENKKEIISPDDINKLSIKQNGINFKQFIFCEEYLKRGRIKPTCDYLGISRNTAYLWLKDNKVKEYLKDRQDEIKKETDATFNNTYNACFNELNKMVNSNYIENSDKIKAIDTFLKHYENLERLKQPLTED